MKTKNVVVIGMVAVLVLLVWYRVVYSSMASQATKATQASQDAEVRVKTLEAEVRKATAEDDGKSHKASLAELQNAIPPTPAMSAFLRAADNVRVTSGVSFQSIVPTAPTALGAIGSINLAITVQGSYAQVRAYQDGLNKLARLAVVDNVQMSAGAAQGTAQATTGGPTGDVFAGQGAAPTLQLQLTARLFTQQAPAPAVTAAPPAATPPPASG